jgi:hypothetical protein
MPKLGWMRVAAALAAVTVPSAAFAQAGLIQSQTGVTGGAIQSEIREAVRPQLQIRNSAGAITGLALSAEGALLAIVPSDHSLRVWDLPNGLQQSRNVAPDALTAAGLAAMGLGTDAQIAAVGTSGDRL